MIKNCLPRLPKVLEVWLAKRAKRGADWESAWNPGGNSNDSDIKRRLSEAFHGKCGYCERPANTVDHFNPKEHDDNLPACMYNKVTKIVEHGTRKELRKKRKAQPIYYHRQPIKPYKKPLENTWDWDNFVWACSICQSQKGSKQANLFINPTHQDPVDYLNIDPITGDIVYLQPCPNGMGGSILEELNLHDPLLKRSRGRKMRRIIALAELLCSSPLNPSQRQPIIDTIVEELHAQESYLGCFRQLCFGKPNSAYSYQYNLVQMLIQIPEVKQVVDMWCIK